MSPSKEVYGNMKERNGIKILERGGKGPTFLGSFDQSTIALSKLPY